MSDGGLNIKDIKTLLKLFDESVCSQMSVRNGDFSIEMKKSEACATVRHSDRCYVDQEPSYPQPLKQTAAQHPELNEAGRQEPSEPEGYLVKSPIVGVFYAQHEPGAEPFVKVGDRVEKGQVLCILESMKMLNEIKSPVSGKIVKIYLKNESMAEFSQPLFLIGDYA